MPPDASSLARPRALSTAARSSSSDMLSSRIRSIPAASASSTSASVAHSTSTGTPFARPYSSARRVASPTPPASAAWFSLTRIASCRPKRWLLPPPATTACFSSTRRPGVVLRVSRIVAPVPATAAT
jgi:hypothetical protein